ncbi:hypothetical protein ABZ329_17200 [Streptomyces rubiginosohelvolus]|uniref:hypothetical protein n=1 Tax=Streptomyces rubiginosohelvolus TaxID=67362 RepID=UPI0033EA33CE
MHVPLVSSRTGRSSFMRALRSLGSWRSKDATMVADGSRLPFFGPGSAAVALRRMRLDN